MTSTTCLELTLPAEPGSIRQAREAAAAAVARIVRRPRLADDVRLCVSEAVTNVVRHAYGRGRGDVEVVVERDEDEVSVVVRDTGRGMTRSERTGAIGGYGLAIIERVADRHRIRSAPGAGVEVEMIFGERKRSAARSRGRGSGRRRGAERPRRPLPA